MADIIKKYIISLPFNLTQYGKVSVIEDNDPKIYRDKIKTLFSTGTNERIWYHNYGANLSDLLFEPYSVAVEDARYAVNQVFASWLPEVTLLDLSASFEEQTGAVVLDLTYKIPSGDVDTVKVSTESLTRSGGTPDEYTERLRSSENG
jgi:phage baseplate assembly protein W